MSESNRDAARAQVESLAAAVNGVVDSWDDVARATTFGRPSFRANGTLFAVVSEQGVSLTSLPAGARSSVVAGHRVVPFEANDRLVGSWVTVPIEPSRVDELADPLRVSYETAHGRKAAGENRES